ncbi:MAG: hypothetical protein GX130_08235 [Candidatus Hydrogenedens sp.]|jgi:phosphatidylserine/phosphatidylglycerophosphate/cardiolipin synthase-like enzyme|nr:hypothetical protein [Candidatus Hydrogenedens sp.]
MTETSSPRRCKAKKLFNRYVAVLVLVFIFLLALVLLGKGIYSCHQSYRDGAPSPSREQVPVYTGRCSSLAGGPVQVYFTEPGREGQPLLLQALLHLIHSASKQICCAFYDLESEEVAQALISRHRQRVQVAIVTDSDYSRRKAIQQCIEAGIPVVFDESNAFMHNKFCIIDGHYVWTGSTNISRNGFYRNNNNAILIQSPELAVNFINEFEEMYLHRSFGAMSPQNTLYSRLHVGEIPLECYFAPEDRAAHRILEYINSSRVAIDFMAFSFTSVPIAEAMASRIRNGVDVRGLFERSQTGNSYSRHKFLAEQGATVYLDNNPKNMHHKVIVVDRLHVITGSYNFSKNAETRNDENVLILSSPDVAACYIKELENQLP